MKLKKLAYKAEPILHLHRYIVVWLQITSTSHRVKYHYCKNLKDAKEYAKTCTPGDVVEIFRASHNFIQAYRVSK